ncbi:unnamed protein product [Darwinula stevensoni]|uniref:Uncharacterized protein n=1 Tax=Darwinula stevensoni TaxID=69355 RepID=A0A7R9A4T8_9CRUS|nr:unnamed protein product [Darwinula stevensoni]CAG0884963.1 unnamed protein product [Darwinula stevensoni]
MKLAMGILVLFAVLAAAFAYAANEADDLDIQEAKYGGFGGGYGGGRGFGGGRGYGGGYGGGFGGGRFRG